MVCDASGGWLRHVRVIAIIGDNEGARALPISAANFAPTLATSAA
jgi:hypothetical protein